ncbi:unnamed protein product [Diplocarpon coronariae]|nr:hypothetical protein JHW43_009304 [Diplocarpon mali]
MANLRNSRHAARYLRSYLHFESVTESWHQWYSFIKGSREGNVPRVSSKSTKPRLKSAPLHRDLRPHHPIPTRGASTMDSDATTVSLPRTRRAPPLGTRLLHPKLLRLELSPPQLSGMIPITPCSDLRIHTPPQRTLKARRIGSQYAVAEPRPVCETVRTPSS